jgi:rare lipoprotein A
VRVTDRGPHSRGRIIDLSYGAARALGMLSQGIAMVEVERVDRLMVPYRDDEETGMPDFEFNFEEMQQSFLKEMMNAKLNAPLNASLKNKEKRIKKTEAHR